MSTAGCGCLVRCVIVQGKSVFIDPRPHPSGTVAARPGEHNRLAYPLPHHMPPHEGYNRYRRHQHEETP